MRYRQFGTLTTIYLLAGLIGFAHAEPPVLQVLKVSPVSVPQKAAKLDISILGDGFSAKPVVKLFPAGTDKLHGISVSRVTFVNPRELIAHVEIDVSVAPGEFDIEVQDAAGGRVLGKRAFLVEPYSWSARFGCTGAEVWRRRIPCKRGTIY
jgi:hypothetical protein